MKRVIFISIVIFGVLAHYLTPFISPYLEESSYFWYSTSSRNLKPKKYKYIILGDSQWISGIHLPTFSKTLNISEDSVLIYSKPSQQLEGIELDLKYLQSKGISAEYYLINLSSTSTTINKVFFTFKSLQLSFGIDSWMILMTPKFWNVFYKDIGSYLYHVLSEIFLILKYNGNSTSFLKILPSVDADFISSQDLNNRIGPPLLELLDSAKNKNRIMESKIHKHGLWEWKNYSEADSNVNCDKEIDLPHLDPNLKLAFAKERKEAQDSLARITKQYNPKQDRFFLVNIPFTKQMREIESVFPIVWNNLAKSNTSYRMLEIPADKFDLRHYNDYTHFNKCGAILFSEILADKLSKKINN